MEHRADATFLKNKIVKLPDGKDILHGMQNYSEGTPSTNGTLTTSKVWTR